MADTVRILIDALWQGKGQAQAARGDLNSMGEAAQQADIRMAAMGQRSSLLGAKMRELGKDVAEGKMSVADATTAYKQYEGTLVDLGDASRKTGGSIRDFATDVAKTAAVIGAVGFAAQQAWQFIGEGAQLELAAGRFDRLAGSIGSVSDAMLVRLRAATSGMVDDATLVASASDIMSLGLQNTEDGVVRLASVTGRLGWDMQQVVLTMANNSEKRLDALGLSIADVEERTRKLQAAGLSLDEAFDLAIIEAGEARVRLLGDTAETTAGQIAQLETAWTNYINNTKRDIARDAAPIIDYLSDYQMYLEKVRQLAEAGVEVSLQDDLRLVWTELTLNNEAGIELVDTLLLETGASKAAAAATEERRRSLGASTAGMREQAAALERLNSVTASWGDVNEDAYTRANEQIDSHRALREALARGYELTATTIEGTIRENIAALEEEKQAAEEAAQAYGRDFAAALEAGETATYDANAALFDQLALLGASPEALMAAGLALTDYSEEALAAALRQAAMNQAVMELAPLLADGSISIQDAIGYLDDLEAQLAEDYTAELDTTSLDDAQETAATLKSTLDSLRGDYTASVNIVVNGTVPNLPGSAPGLPPVPQGAFGSYATGTGGWLEVPGPLGSPQLAIVHGGEGLNVDPAGVPAGGGGVTYVDNSVHNYRSREATALALAQVKLERRRRVDRMMGRA